jgi:hypothetical protein
MLYTACSGLSWSPLRLVLPSEEELKEELEREKRFLETTARDEPKE